MITRKDLLNSPEYWFEEAQNELFRKLTAYMEREKLTQTDLAEKLGVTKGYVSQILNGNFNYTLKKLIELSLSIGLAPTITYQSVETVIAKESTSGLYSLPSFKGPQVALGAKSDSGNVTVDRNNFKNTETIRTKVA